MIIRVHKLKTLKLQNLKHETVAILKYFQTQLILKIQQCHIRTKNNSRLCSLFLKHAVILFNVHQEFHFAVVRYIDFFFLIMKFNPKVGKSKTAVRRFLVPIVRAFFKANSLFSTLPIFTLL